MKNLLISIVLITLCIVTLHAQQNTFITIKGKVLEKGTGAPMEDVNVFLSNTTIGTTTDKYGKFVINSVPYGSYKIVFSFIGYKTEINSLSSFKKRAFNFNIYLKQKPINLNQVNVTGVVSKEWKDELKIFTKAFIGDTKNSSKTKILNPEVLNFMENKKTKILKANSDSTIVVENKALGYNLYIVLDSFELESEGNLKYICYTRFKKLNHGSEKQKLDWKNNRQNTYIDSQKRFFYSLVHKQLEKDYYSLREGQIENLLKGKGEALSPSELDVTSNSDSSIYTFYFSGWLYVRRYFDEPSYLNFIYPFISIDRNGNLITSTYAVETYGYWSKNRIADLLPQNYIYTGQ